MDKNLDTQIVKALKAYLTSGVEDQVDYKEFYFYSIVPHFTAIEGSTITEIENKLLFGEDIAVKKGFLAKPVKYTIRSYNRP